MILAFKLNCFLEYYYLEWMFYYSKRISYCSISLKSYFTALLWEGHCTCFLDNKRQLVILFTIVTYIEWYFLLVSEHTYME